MRYATLALVAIAFAAYAIAFGSESIETMIFFLPFTMPPFAITAVLAFRWRTVVGQSVLIVGAVAYAAWFAYAYLSATKWHVDPQSGLVFVWVGIYAAPVLGLLWWGGWWWEKRGRLALEAEPYDPGLGR